MAGFLSWFFAFITTMFSGIWSSIKGFFKGIFMIFDFKTYFGLFAHYQEEFGPVGWILAVLCFVLVYAFWAGLIFLIVLLVRKYLRFRQTLVGNEDLLEEIAELHRSVVKLSKEKEKILNMKLSPGIAGYEELQAELRREDGEIDPYSTTVPAAAVGAAGAYATTTEASHDAEKPEGKSDNRFFRLTAVDDKYTNNMEEREYVQGMSLSELCDDLRNFACYNNHLYYEIKTIRLMLAGLASTKLIILQGISGTGKTSLPYMMGKYFKNDSTIASVQPSWRDRSELFGFFNEFTKKFNETEVLNRIYESSFNDDINIIILDEMNIARVEYYFAEMLSILEMPDPNEWRIQLVYSVWSTDPIHLEDGKLKIPQNVWYIGTANNDDSTFAISDKVYDRALVINLDTKGIPFEPVPTEAKRVNYSYVDELYKKAIEEYAVGQETLGKIETLDLYVIEHFRVAFGNRILKQLKMFVPVYVACGGEEVEAVDYLLATKVFRKFEGLNLGLIRDEIKGLIMQLNTLFGNDMMTESIAFLRRLQKSY